MTRLASATAAAAIAIIALSAPFAVQAEPTTLKLSFPSSDRSQSYITLAKPLVDAINDDPRDLLKIVVYFSGKLGPPNRQAQLVADGTADIAFVIPGLESKRFPDVAAVELPGLFRSTREASLVHTRLVAKKALRGYEDFFVIGAVATQPETVNSRKPTASLADLKGQTLRVNNPVAATALAGFGVSAKVISLNDTADAIGRGTVDGAVLQLAQVFDYGIGRLARHHYLLPVGSAPLALVMNRKVFDGLPEEAKTLIRDHSGDWLAERYAELSDAINLQVIDRLRADRRRSVTQPTAADLAVAQRAYEIVAESWAATSPRNRELLALVKAELAERRSLKGMRP